MRYIKSLIPILLYILFIQSISYSQICILTNDKEQSKIIKNDYYNKQDYSNSPMIKWFKNKFKHKIEEIIKDTPFSVDMITAIARQETGYIWGRLYKDTNMTTERILELCVGDIYDCDDDRDCDAFPKDKEDLISYPQGIEMFKIARQALENIAKYDSAYNRTLKNPNKFCHGFGIFQYDLQYFKTTPNFFLNKEWNNFDSCLALFVKTELDSALIRAYGKNKKTLTEREMVYVAIAYNRGSVNVNGDFKQGHNQDGKYYGEYIHKYMELAKKEK